MGAGYAHSSLSKFHVPHVSEIIFHSVKCCEKLSMMCNDDSSYKKRECSGKHFDQLWTVASAGKSFVSKQ